MSTTAIASTKDQLAAQLGLAAPTARVNFSRLSFSTILSDSRANRVDADLRPDKSDIKAKDTSLSERPATSKKPDRPQRPAISQLEAVSQSIQQPFEAAVSAAQRPAHDKSDAQADAPRREPGDVAKEDNGQPVTAALGLQTDAQGEAATTQVPNTLVPNLPTEGIELPVSQLLADTQANPQGVALTGAVEESMLPTLVTPLTQPQGSDHGLLTAQNATANATAAEHRAEAATNALLGALVTKATARGQNNLINNGANASDKPRATLPGNAQSTPAATNAQAFIHSAVFVDPGPAQDGVLPNTEPAAPATNTAPQAAEGEVQVRATLLPNEGGVLFGKPAAQNGAQQGQTNGTTGTPVTPGPNNLPDAPTPPAQTNADAAATAAQTQAALAARAATDQSRVSFDGSTKAGGDPLLQNVGATSETGTATGDAAARAAAARGARAPIHQLPVAEQVAVRISKAIADGADKIEIRLKPASLGTVRISLEVGHDGRVLAVISADRAETLDMLKQDSRALERALQEAGLKTDSNSLSFNLRGGDGNESQDADKANGAGILGSGDDAAEDGFTQSDEGMARFFRGDGLLDIHV